MAHGLGPKPGWSNLETKTLANNGNGMLYMAMYGSTIFVEWNLVFCFVDTLCEPQLVLEPAYQEKQPFSSEWWLGSFFPDITSITLVVWSDYSLQFVDWSSYLHLSCLRHILCKVNTLCVYLHQSFSFSWFRYVSRWWFSPFVFILGTPITFNCMMNFGYEFEWNK